ncbi:DUF445 family protein [Halarsenatibacter silvermanii]|uniref:Uncharacterized membrane protein YheB, UPF0754 family n=1 Tax=Halarsenatibacter silvermanii TaxID=321763 RepID=A0A1G9MFV4_9FIRM|nr:DUF445 family protein [Halarsenatibacter silvermanii]SDL72777.1 Uncharacterized membrane protein YheB, UPF0754 family [Halarsenatibacter silvermanii]
MMNLAALLASGITGSATGYITNDVAVKMLFRSYGPFGGVLESTREEFILNMSRLVEDEIINYRTLADELEKTEVQEEIDSLIEEIIAGQLPAQFSGRSWADVPGWEKSRRGLSELLIDRRLIRSLAEDLLETTDLSGLFSREQLANMSESLLREIRHLLADDEVCSQVSGFLDLLLQILYDEKAPEELEEEKIRRIQQALAGRKGRLRELLAGFIEDSGLKAEWEARIENMLKTPLGQWESRFFQKESFSDERNSIARLLQNFNNFLAREEPRKILRELVQAFISSLQRIDLTLPEIIGEGWQDRIRPLIEKNLPPLIETVLWWLDENRTELEEIIDETIDEVLETGSGLKNSLKNILFRALEGKLARRYGVVDDFVEKLNTERERDKLAEEISMKITELLEAKTLGWLVSRLKNQGEFNWDYLFDRINEVLSDIQKLFADGDAAELELVPSRLIDSQNLLNSFPEKTSVVLADSLLNLLLIPSSAPRIAGFLKRLLTGILNSEAAEEILTEIADFSGSFQISDRNINILVEKVDSLLSGVGEGFTGFSSGDSRLFQQFYTAFSPAAVSWMDKILKTQEDEKIGALISRITDIPGYETRLRNFSLNILEENLAVLLEDRVSRAVSDNLLSLSAEKMKEIVEDFIGRELKPITYFGGGLGFLAGVSLELFGGNLLPGAEILGGFFWPALTYGMVGFLTNVIAINMIFRPHNPVHILEKKLPFTPGLIPRNQDRFAEALGNFVEKDLLEPARISRLIKNSRSELERALERNLLSNDFRRLRLVLRTSSDNFARRLNELVRVLMVDNSAGFSEKLSEFMRENVDTAGAVSYGVEALLPLLEEHKIEFVPSFAKILQRSAAEEKPLSEIFGQELQPDFSAGFSRFSEKDVDHIKKKLISSASSFDISGMAADFLSDREDIDLENLISPGYRKDIEKFIEDKACEFLHRRDLAKINSGINCDFFRDLYSGKGEKVIGDLLEANFDDFLNIFVQRSLSFISENRDEIKRKSLEMVRQQLKEREEKQGILSGIFLRGAYQLTDGEATVEEVIDVLIDQKLPAYLQRRREDIGSRLKPVLNRTARNISDDLLSRTGSEGWAEIMGIAAARPGVEKNFKNFSRSLFDRLWKIEFPLEILAGFLGGDKAELRDTFLERRNEKIEADARDSAVRKILRLGEIGLEEIFNQFSPADFLEFITGHKSPGHDYFRKVLQTREDELRERISEIFQAAGNLYKEKNRGENKGEGRSNCLFDEEIFKKDMNWWLRRLEKNEAFWERTSASLDSFLERVSARLPRHFEEATLEYLVLNLSRGTLDGLEVRFQSLMDSLAIKDITIDRVQNMDSEAVESLFKSFAGRYLNRLKIYGFSGSFFGLLAEMISRLAALS